MKIALKIAQSIGIQRNNLIFCWRDKKNKDAKKDKKAKKLEKALKKESKKSTKKD